MITAFPLSRGNMLGFTIDGEVDDEGMRRLLLALEAKVTAHGKVRLLGNIKSIGSFESFQSFGKLLRAKTELWDKVEKYAILTDYSWLSRISGGIDWLTPRMEVKTFALSEGELAHQWLKLDPVDPATEASVFTMPLDSPTVLGLRITGKLSDADRIELNRILDASAREGGPTKLLLDVSGVDLRTIEVFFKGISDTSRALDRMQRVAFLGNQTMLRIVVKGLDIVWRSTELAIFPPEEQRRAIAWLD